MRRSKQMTNNKFVRQIFTQTPAHAHTQARKQESHATDFDSACDRNPKEVSFYIS